MFNLNFHFINLIYNFEIEDNTKTKYAIPEWSLCCNKSYYSKEIKYYLKAYDPKNLLCLIDNDFLSIGFDINEIIFGHYECSKPFEIIDFPIFIPKEDIGKYYKFDVKTKDMPSLIKDPESIITQFPIY